MTLAQAIALRIPPLRRLHADRNQLARRLHALEAQPQPQPQQNSPFYHYHAAFDAIEVMLRHAAPAPEPLPGYHTNYLGVRIDPKVAPGLLQPGVVEGAPIPANWHADIAEWAAALRAVDLARDQFTIVELGCGWGCWMNNTGVAARRAGLRPMLIGVEGDAVHVGYAREACAINGFGAAQAIVHHGIAAAEPGTVLFPRHLADMTYGLEPVFGASPEQRRAAAEAGTHDELPVIPLADIMAPYLRIDLLHVDIQGGEADLVAGCLASLQEKVAYLLVGTHSRPIEGRLFELLSGDGWVLDMERPAILTIQAGRPVTVVDGVQGWRNPRVASLQAV